jgi:hypothetical protein
MRQRTNTWWRVLPLFLLLPALAAAQPDGAVATADVAISLSSDGSLLTRSVFGQGTCDGIGLSLRMRGTAGQVVTGSPQGGAVAGRFGFWHTAQRPVGVRPVPVAEQAPRIQAIWPQPASSQLLLRCTAPRPRALTVAVTDILGRLLLSMELDMPSTGALTVAVPVGRLPAGSYVLRLIGSSATSTARVVVLR